MKRENSATVLAIKRQTIVVSRRRDGHRRAGLQRDDGERENDVGGGCDMSYSVEDEFGETERIAAQLRTGSRILDLGASRQDSCGEGDRPLIFWKPHLRVPHSWILGKGGNGSVLRRLRPATSGPQGGTMRPSLHKPAILPARGSPPPQFPIPRSSAAR